MESGLGTFRGPGGVWEKFDVEELGTPQAFAKRAEFSFELEVVPGHVVVGEGGGLADEAVQARLQPGGGHQNREQRRAHTPKQPSRPPMPAKLHFRRARHCTVRLRNCQTERL